MLDERTRRLGQKWGTVAVLVQMWIAGALGWAIIGDLHRFFGQHGVAIFLERMSQMRPAAFKRPWNDLYVGLFVAAVLSLLVWLWGWALRESRRRP
jgi:hypothetical protein